MNYQIVSGLTAIDALQGALSVWINVGNNPQSLRDEGWLNATCHSSKGIRIDDLVHAMHLYSDCHGISIDEINASNVYICKEDPSLTDTPKLAKLTYQSIIQEIHELSISKKLMKLATALNENAPDSTKSKSHKRAL